LYTEKGETQVKYYVTVHVEETLVIDDVLTEAEAIKRALQCFDATAHDPEITEVWTEDDY
jgi:orotate phosphoribosyltransferase-like protein